MSMPPMPPAPAWLRWLILALPPARVADFKAAVNRTLYGEIEDVLQTEIRSLLAALADPETPGRIAAFARS